MVLTAQLGSGDLFWWMLWFFLWVIWIWMLIAIFTDIFRSPDLGGWGKALWSVFVIVLPYLGVLVYLIARGRKMSEHAVQDAQQRDAMFRSYVQSAAGTKASAAEEIGRLAELRDAGVLTADEFQAAKAKALA